MKVEINKKDKENIIRGITLLAEAESAYVNNKYPGSSYCEYFKQLREFLEDLVTRDPPVEKEK